MFFSSLESRSKPESSRNESRAMGRLHFTAPIRNKMGNRTFLIAIATRSIVTCVTMSLIFPKLSLRLEIPAFPAFDILLNRESHVPPAMLLSIRRLRSFVDSNVRRDATEAFREVDCFVQLFAFSHRQCHGFIEIAQPGFFACFFAVSTRSSDSRSAPFHDRLPSVVPLWIQTFLPERRHRSFPGGTVASLPRH